VTRVALPAALVDAARQGDQAAMVSSLAISQPDIRRYARASCRIDDVDDATQEALWLLARRLGTLRVVAALPAWLFAVVRRECRRLAQRALGADQPLDMIEDSLRFATRPEAELRLDLAAALQSLPAHYRTILLMRDVEEFSVDEIAEALSLSREAVKARLHRARGLVRQYLKA
jgi:RNA polymerase sigma-70 factor (ECF subfamily)